MKASTKSFKLAKLKFSRVKEEIPTDFNIKKRTRLIKKKLWLENISFFLEITLPVAINMFI